MDFLMEGVFFTQGDYFRVARDSGAIRKLQGTTFRELCFAVSER